MGSLLYCLYVCSGYTGTCCNGHGCFVKACANVHSEKAICLSCISINCYINDCSISPETSPCEHSPGLACERPNPVDVLRLLKSLL